MKINRIKATPQFTPIVLTLTIESEEELRALTQFSSCNITNVELIVDDGNLDYENKGNVIQFLGNLYDGLVNG